MTYRRRETLRHCLSVREINREQVNSFGPLRLALCGRTEGFSTLSISFKPVSAGGKSASVSVTDSASGSPQKITLSGTGD